MSRKGGAKKRKVDDDFDWSAVLGEEESGGVDLDQMGRVLVENSKIK
jgi:hypothetical protein